VTSPHPLSYRGEGHDLRNCNTEAHLPAAGREAQSSNILFIETAISLRLSDFARNPVLFCADFESLYTKTLCKYTISVRAKSI